MERRESVEEWGAFAASPSIGFRGLRGRVERYAVGGSQHCATMVLRVGRNQRRSWHSFFSRRDGRRLSQATSSRLRHARVAGCPDGHVLRRRLLGCTEERPTARRPLGVHDHDDLNLASRQSFRTVDRDKLTPLFRHYISVKEAHPDAVLMYQCGDFFEAFFEDAHILHEKLELALTGKEAGKEIGRVPMAGVPVASLDRHCAALLALGYPVAVVEQVEEVDGGRRPTDGTLLRRELTRRMTPGTVMEAALLDARRNNYLAAVCPGSVLSPASPADEIGLAYVDVSTGELAVTVVHDADEAAAELSRVSPSEVLLPRGCPPIEQRIRHALTGMSVSLRPVEEFGPDAARTGLARRFGSVEAALAADSSPPDAVQLAPVGALLAFLRQTLECVESSASAYDPSTPQRSSGWRPPVPLQPLRVYRLQSHVILDVTAIRNLEILTSIRDGRSARGSLLWALDATVTAMGGRLLRRWLTRPSRDRRLIERRLDRVQHWSTAHRQRERLRAGLRRVADLERLAGRVGTQRANPRELYTLAASLCQVPMLLEMAAAIGVERDSDLCTTPPRSWTPAEQTLFRLAYRAVHEAFLSPDEELTVEAAERLPPELRTKGKGSGRASAPATAVPFKRPSVQDARPIFRRGYHRELDELRDRANGDLEWIARYEAAERQRSGISQLRVGYHSLHGYFLQIPRRLVLAADTAAGDGGIALPSDYSRRQTLKAVERYVTPELRAREQAIFGAKAQAVWKEWQLYLELQAQFAERVSVVRTLCAELAELDVLLGFAEVAARHGYCRPAFVSEEDVAATDEPPRRLEIEDGRHPVVERTLPPETPFVPNSIRIGDGHIDLMLLMGANSSGKSVFLRQVALIQVMAQCGSFVPARHATLSLADRIFTRVGAVDDIAAAQSTFVVEMSETSAILRHATRASLVLLDEVGRGTATADGVAIAQAVAEHLASPSVRARCIFATHFHELASLEAALPNVATFRMAVLEQPTADVDDRNHSRIVFLHRIERGAASHSFGIEVARMCGLPEAVLHRAQTLLAEKQSPEGIPSEPNIENGATDSTAS